MKQIALIGVDLNAALYMTEQLSYDADVRVVNYLDTAIREITAREGEITDSCIGRMIQMITHACEDGADGILITCTIFSSYLETFRSLFSKNIVGADVAMMEEVGAQGGRIALLCTFAATKEKSQSLLDTCCKKAGKTYEIKTFVLGEAYEAAQRSDRKKHDQLIRETVKKMDQEYDQIVLAQISMAGAVRGLKLRHARLSTSPGAAWRWLQREIEE